MGLVGRKRKERERVGELIVRLGLRRFLKDMGLKPDPRMITAPRYNPYVYWQPEEIAATERNRGEVKWQRPI